MGIQRIAVLGSGIMGHGIAQVSAMSGYHVALRDIKQEFLDNAMKKIRWSLDKMASKGKMSGAEVDEILSRLSPTTDLGAAAGDADMIIEAVPEIMDLKRAVYGELDKIALDGAIFASNTSTLPITEIAATTARPRQCIGVHFFNPPQLMKLVEVIPGRETSRDILDATVEYVKSVGKSPIVCRKDVPGFIVNRLFIPLVHEACHVADSLGYEKEVIDSAAKFRLGFPMGIFELADFTGMDVIHKATEEMYSRDPRVVNPHPRIRELYDEKKLGKKTGEGFYGYSDENYERVELSEDLGSKCDSVRLVANVVNNAAWLVSNGASEISEIENAAALGLGLKRPIFETAREIGISRIISELESLAGTHGESYAPDPLLGSLE